MFAKSLGGEIELRLIEERHTQDAYETVRRNLAHLKPWMPWATDDYSLEAARTWQRSTLDQFARNDGLNAGIFHSGRFIGVVGMHHADWLDRKASIGYWIDLQHQGRGIVTAACRALLSHIFEELKLHRVEIRCAVGNHRSRSIPERLGFQLEGIARQSSSLQGEFENNAVYSMLAPEWVGTRGGTP
jgi:ribosomal-protein-serine acetyltransferase